MVQVSPIRENIIYGDALQRWLRERDAKMAMRYDSATRQWTVTLSMAETLITVRSPTLNLAVADVIWDAEKMEA